MRCLVSPVSRLLCHDSSWNHEISEVAKSFCCKNLDMQRLLTTATLSTTCFLSLLPIHLTHIPISPSASLISETGSTLQPGPPIQTGDRTIHQRLSIFRESLRNTLDLKEKQKTQKAWGSWQRCSFAMNVHSLYDSMQPFLKRKLLCSDGDIWHKTESGKQQFVASAMIHRPEIKSLCMILAFFQRQTITAS